MITMVSRKMITLSLLVCFCFVNVEAQGNMCTRDEVTYYTAKECENYNFGICVTWKYVIRSRTERRQSCCAGWTGTNCNTAICSPECRNGGTCIAPNQCRCPPGLKGDICNGGCSTIAASDVIFTIDESGSVGSSSFSQTLESLAKTVDKLAVRDDLLRIGMSLFNSYVRTRFNLNYSFSKSVIKQTIRSTGYNSGGTNIGRALEYSCEQMFVSSNGDRPEASNVLVLLTDGRSGESKSAALAKCASKNVTIIGVGIGSGINEAQLRALVSKPEYYITTTYQALENTLPVLVTQSVDCSTFDQSCSHVQPCYPGRCSGAKNNCTCSTGFTGESCLTLVSVDFKPTIEKSNASFIQYSFSEQIEEYRYMADATGKYVTDVTWTNQEKFNILQYNLEASLDVNYTFSGIPSTPYYIGEFKLGIVNAFVRILHEKLTSGGKSIVTNKTHHCVETLNNIIANRVMRCPGNDSNIIQFDSADVYQLRFSVTTGGYRKLIDLERNVVQSDNYTGVSAIKVMEFRFDYVVPEHCIDNNACTGTSEPLKLEEDITKKSLKPRWSGWADALSGISRYIFEVWKMEYSLDNNGLKEPGINATFNPIPLFIKEVFPNGSLHFPVYTPPGPGVYSTILEVNDRANNSRYARRIAIFDDSSQISISQTHPLFVTSASSNSNYTWQTSASSVIQLSWTKHFINEVHENGHFLSKILDYEPRLSDGVDRHYYKKIESAFDDNDGDRTKSPIQNLNSIVRFQTKVSMLPSGPTIHSWSDVVPLSETKLVNLQISINDGDGFQFSVQAYDVMGNTKIDTTNLYFDSSAPRLFQPQISLNVKDGNFPFSTRVNVTADDKNSGLTKVSFKFYVNSTEEAKKQTDYKLSPVANCNSRQDCYCIPKGDCYLESVGLDINNCWLKVSKENVDKDVLMMEVTAYNSAMLSAKKVFTFGKVDKLDGIQQYYSPSNIEIQKKTDTSISISWTQAPTCYDRTGIVIRLFFPDNTSLYFDVHKEATTFDLTGLSPTTSYWFEMFTKYGNDTHSVTSANPAIFTFQTTAEEAKGSSAAAIGGTAGGLLFLLLIAVIALLILGRLGKLQPAKRKMTAGLRTIRNTIKYNDMAVGYNNRACRLKEDDDIYVYGEMDVAKVQGWTVPRNNVALESELTRGRFAIIYLAKYYTHADAKTIVAKTVIEDHNEEAIMKLKAKINFFGSKVGHHKNVLDFIGYTEDDARGPMMLLEYCAKGTLRDFLHHSKNNATVELEERLCRMAFGICLGMDYLASNKVVHRRLAARNILLNDIYDPKIAGFGPDPNEETEHHGQTETNERIPIKWMAPECVKSTVNANELSDVWSFAIVLWEIFSLGETPYPGLQSREVPSKLKQGYKMAKPEYCDDKFYSIMRKCWRYDPRKRTGFAQIKDEMNAMFTESPDDDYYYYSRNDF